ncbi:hypothetical protein BJV82DRAFT_675742 [Fennellomyces sp. T-0311]|nr:hypothetical protein BJV82DRAFT_675742 [Fennellomyces sp. T-0311]
MQNGLGVHRLQRLLQEFHTLRYARRHLQYLNALVHRQKYPTLHDHNVKYKSFSTFTDRYDYAGYVPSTGYLRLVYTALLDQLRPLIDKELAVLGGIILKGDHSFEVPKHMAKLGGSSAFSALYTVCNEYEEIRLQLLVPTKSPAHLEQPLKDMINSYGIYNQKLPELFFHGQSAFSTANRINRRPKHIQFLELPSTVAVDVIKTSTEAANAVCEIYKHVIIPCRLVVGFDCEWNYNSVTNAVGKISLVQVACLDKVWIFRIQPSQGVPHALTLLINDPNIFKIGRNVTGDLKKLNRNYNVTWKGALELGSFCRRRGKIHRSTMGLSEISAAVLGGYLRKEPTTCLSNWECNELSEVQKAYAALDAWASLKVFDVVKDSQMFEKHVPASAPHGLPCSLQYAGTAVAFSRLNNQIGQDSEDSLFTVTKIVVPGAVVMSADGKIKVLSDFDGLPFTIKTSRAYLRTENPDLCTPDQTPRELLSQVASTEQNRTDADIDESFEIRSISTLSSCSSSEGESENNEVMLRQATQRSNRIQETLHSIHQQDRNPRILKDIFHLMAMLKISKRHGLAKEFARRFRDAISIINTEDRNRVERHLRSIGMSWNYMFVKNPAWVGSKNRHGRVHLGHYDPWLTQTIHHLQVELGMYDTKWDADQSSTLIVKNALQLKMPAETFGIASFPSNVADDISIQKSSPDQVEPSGDHYTDPMLALKLSMRQALPVGETGNSRGRMYKYIASRLQTLHAVTPVHTSQEFALFTSITPQTSTNFAQRIDWKGQARLWNRSHANGIDIFYKTPEILKTHYNTWCTSQTAIRTIASHDIEVQIMRDQLQSPGRNRDIINLPANLPESAHVVANDSNSMILPPATLNKASSSIINSGTILHLSMGFSIFFSTSNTDICTAAIASNPN